MWHCISYMIEVIVYCYQGLAAILAAILKNNKQMILNSILLDLPTQKHLENITYRALYVACNLKYCRKHQFSYNFNF